MSSDIIVDTDARPTTSPSNGMTAEEQALVSWVMETIKPWRQHRDDNYVKMWDKYLRIYRGIHKDEDKLRVKERSKFIHPASRQAVDSVVGELEDAIFGKPRWFDLRDDITDEMRQDMTVYRDLLAEDMELAKIPKAVKDTFQLGGILGPGISKITVQKEPIKIPTLVIDEEENEVSRKVVEEMRVVVRLEPLYPHAFIIDPVARSIEESLGVAHELLRPGHLVRSLQAKGVYLPHQFGDATEVPSSDALRNINPGNLSNKVVLTEYWGLVPANLLELDKEDVIEKFLDDGKSPSYMVENNTEMVEAVVTIANGSVLLRAQANPYLFKDRPFVAYQHCTVPNQFWGTGVVEAGYNVQVSLDNEMRTRQDAMAYTAHPMIAINSQRMPRNQNPQVYAGKVWKVNGQASDAITPVTFGDVNPSTFTQSGELERLHQNAVGYQDSATPVGISPRNATLGGMSMITTGSLKRIKTALQNIERDYLTNLVWKIAVRYMQFAPDRYPVADYRFRTVSAMSLVAEEQEQNQLLQLMQVVPPESPMFPVLLKHIISNTSLTASPELMQAADAWVQQALAGPSQEEQAITNAVRALGIEEKQLDNEETKAKISKLLEEAKAIAKNANVNALNALTNSYEAGKGDSNERAERETDSRKE